MAAILYKNTRKILALKNITAHPPCNCQRKAECYLNKNYCKIAIIYKASISANDNDPLKCSYGC